MSMATDYPPMNEPPAVPADSPLTRLDLTPVELQALRRQGSVCLERRGQSQVIYKLRFRIEGRQKGRYLGRDPAFARAVAEELRRLQWRREQMRILRQWRAKTTQFRREAKAMLEPHVKRAGLVFHGFSVRRPRKRQNDS